MTKTFVRVRRWNRQGDVIVVDFYVVLVFVIGGVLLLFVVVVVVIYLGDENVLSCSTVGHAG